MGNRSNKYESEIHIGFLVIVCLLLLLSFVSNYIIFKASSEYREQAARQMRARGLAIGRELRSMMPKTPEDSQIQYMMANYGLSDLLITPSVTDSSGSAQSPREMLTAIVDRLPLGKLPQLADRLLKGELDQLHRGEGDEYFYIHPVKAGGNRMMIIMALNRADLAYLDDAKAIMSYMLPSALVLVLIIYLLLSRRIFSPVRKIIEQAARIGRSVDTGKDDAEAVVDEYKAVIEQLRLKEKQLLQLNAEAHSRADSLQLFNQHLLASSESGIVTFDNQGKLQTVNESARSILRTATCSDAESDSSDPLGCYPQLAELVRSAVTDHASCGYREMSISSHDGPRLDIGLTISIIKDAEDCPVGISMLMNDLTERNRLRRDNEKNSRLMALGEMSGGLAHQLRNSMGAIGGYGKLLKKRAAGSEQMVEMVESLVGETNEAEQLISRFLNFARPLEFDPSPGKLLGLVEETVKSFEVREELSNILFRIESSIDPQVSMDSPLLKQALANIIDNAVRSYDGKPGEVCLVVDQDGDTVRLMISDHGCGIPIESMDSIFTPFFSSRPSGTGLGLPLAGRIVDLHDGRISVDSEPGDGTRFTILLPAERPASKKQGQPVSVIST